MPPSINTYHCRYLPVAIITGKGNYKFIKPTVCTIIPKLTIVNVAYGSLTNIIRTTSTRNAQGGRWLDPLEPGIVANVATQSIWMRFSGTQGLDDNSFGDALASVYWSRPESSGTVEAKRQLLHTILVSFVHGTKHQAFTGLTGRLSDWHR